MKNKILSVILILSLIALAVSILIVAEDAKRTQGADSRNFVCSATGSDCAGVQTSKYGEFLGIKLGYLGVGAFTLFVILLVLLIAKSNKYLEWIVVFGGIVAGLSGAIFIVLQFFVIKQYCIYCLIVDFSSIIIMILSLLYLTEMLSSRRYGDSVRRN